MLVSTFEARSFPKYFNKSDFGNFDRMMQKNKITAVKVKNDDLSWRLRFCDRVSL